MLFIFINSQLFAQNNNITNISFSKNVNEFQCRINSSKRVPFGSIWLPESQRLLVYVRKSSWQGDNDKIVPKAGPVNNINISQDEDDPEVVEVTLDFIENRKYSIEHDGLDIVVFIEGDNSISQKQFFQDQSVNKIERVGPLYASHIVNMDYKEADIPNVLRLLARQNDLNIVAGSDIKGNITLSLHNVTLKEALDNILLANGFDYVMEDNVILVKPGDKFYPSLATTKVYRLKYVDAQNLKNVLKDLLPEATKIQVLSPGFYSENIGETGQQVQKDDIKKRSSTLVVTERPDVIEKIDEIVAKLDIPVPQIMIESKLLELSPMHNEQLGIDWDKTINAALMFQDILPNGDAREYSTLNSDLKGSGSWKIGHLSTGQFNFILNFLKENTETKLVSNPRVIATDNVTSSISVGTTFPIPQINRGLGGQGDIVTFQYKDVDIALNVTPHVVNNNEIIMYVNPIIEEITGEVVIDKNRAPITTKRAVTSVITVKDGETIVIGGMIKEDQKTKISKVFLLGDVPLLGNLFRHKSVQKQQKDLIIFITPHILR